MDTSPGRPERRTVRLARGFDTLNPTHRVAVLETRSPPRDVKVGDSVAGEYRLVRQIGEGGMGAVYEARNRLGRAVAIKLLHSCYLEHEEVVRRFLSEGAAAALIRHPGVIDVFEAGWTEEGGLPYLAMELLVGRNLASEMTRCGPLPPRRVRAIGVQMLDALAAAHAAGVVHRDLKPANVFLVPDGLGELVKLLDLGISKVAGAAAVRTQAGQILGTPAYMAPEQALSATLADHRADLYSVGAMMFEMVAGIPPVVGGNVLLRLRLESPPSLLDVEPEAPAALVAIVDRALRRDRAERWSSAREMRDALAAAVLGRDRPADRVIDSDVVTVSNEKTLPETIAAGSPAPFVAPLQEQHTVLLPGVSVTGVSEPELELELELELEVELDLEEADAVGDAPKAARSRPWHWALALVVLLVIAVSLACAAVLSGSLAMANPPPDPGPPVTRTR